MSNDKATDKNQNKLSDDARGRSTIEFPYLDLESAIQTATGVRDVGGTTCSWEQLAAHLKQAPGGGGFRLRGMASRSFGLINYERGTVTLTELGMRAIDPKHARAARVDAFLTVPLFKAAYERLKGQMLPPVPAIERMLETLGVAPKQKDKARQVFIRSAKQAAFFELDQDRLVLPPLGNNRTPEIQTPSPDSPPPKARNDGDDYGLHPFVKGLLEKLPDPETEWSVQGRAKWLQTASNIFDLMYLTAEDDEPKVIEIKVSSI